MAKARKKENSEEDTKSDWIRLICKAKLIPRRNTNMHDFVNVSIFFYSALVFKCSTIISLITLNYCKKLLF